MVLHKTIKILIFVFFINNCYAKSNVKPRVYKILEKGNKVVLKNDDSGGYNPKELLKFVQNYADVEYHVPNILNKKKFGKYPDGKHPLGTKRILAKRIVPPGKKTPDFEYDKKYETYFKPLVKIHKVKKMDKQEADVGASSDLLTSSSSENDASEQDIKNYDIDGLMYKTDSNLLKLTGKPKEMDKSEIINKKEKDLRMSIEEQGARFLKDIQQMTHILKDKRERNIIRDRVSHVVQELENLHGSLFNLIEKTSNLRQTNHDAGAGDDVLTMPTPGKDFDKDATAALEAEQLKHQKVPAYLPHNPLWNFWTVRQPIKL